MGAQRVAASPVASGDGPTTTTCGDNELSYELNMRMWMVDPRKLCDKHLLGEHVELHMLVGSLRKKKTLTGFLEGGLVELHSIRSRHQELIAEMTRRGFRH